MFNTDGRLTRLVEAIIKTFSPQEKQDFERQFTDLASCNGVFHLMHGLTPSQFHEYFRSSLIHISGISEEGGNRVRAAELWNPLLATTLAQLIEVISDSGASKSSDTEQISKPSILTKTRAGITKEKVTPSKAVKEPHKLSVAATSSVAPIGKAPKVAAMAAAGADAGRSVSSSTAKPKVKGRATQIAKVPPSVAMITTPFKGPPPREHHSPSAKQDLAPSTTEIRTYLMGLRSSDVHLYAQHPWIANVCKVKKCRFCQTMFMNVSVTKCCSDKSFPCTRDNTQCSPSGYYPHVGKSLWKMIKGAHQVGKSFVPKPGTPRTLTVWNPAQRPVIVASRPKRPRTTAESDISDDVSVLSIDSPRQPEVSASWAEQVEEDMRDRET